MSRPTFDRELGLVTLSGSRFRSRPSYPLDTVRAVLFGASRGRYRRVIPDALSRISELRKAEQSPAELELGAV